MRARKGIAVWLMAWALGASTAGAAPPMQIKFAEAVKLPAVAGKAEFDAYGRRFALTLESNDRLLKAIPVARKMELGQSQVLRGKVDGVPGSWVRLTRVGNGVEGAIWDGSDIYVVARYGSIVGKLTTPLVAADEQTVVYRLSDTLNGLPPEFCGLAKDDAANGKSGDSALLQYKSLVTQLRVNAATAVSDQLDISLVADTDFQAFTGSAAADTMLARLNVVDGIFAEQVGVLLVPTEFRLVPANADPFTSTDASALLDQLATFRASTPALHAAGLTHLMTGKNLDEDIIGIAFVDSLCDAQEGVSLSDSEEGEFLSALVMAHEIGHNFGARHDGVAGVCAGTPQTFLMSPTLNGSAQFSACSLNSMLASVAGARGVCIGSANYVDVALVLPPSPYSAQTNGTFSLPITVRSHGNLVATNVQLKVTFPVYYNVQSATMAGANCSLASGVITCALADVAVGEERALDLRVTGNAIGSFPVQAVLSADNDRLLKNNTGQVQVGLVSGVDLAVTVATSATTVFVTDPVDYTVDVTSRGVLASHGGRAQIHIGGIPIESFNAGPHACAIDSSLNWILICQLADIAVGASTRITVRGRPDQARIASGVVEIDLQNDINQANNSVPFSVVVSAEREVRTSVSREELRAVVGTTYELTYTLNALGRLPAQNVRFMLQQPPMGVVESVVAGSVACVADPEFTTCNFGTLNPGAVRTVVVRFHITASITSFMNGIARYGAAGNDYSNATTWVYANVSIDVAASAGTSFVVDEDVIGEAGFGVETKGVNPAQNVSATLELAPPLRLLSLNFDLGPSGWTCTLLTSQRGRCTGSFAGGTQFNQTNARMIYTFVSNTAGTGLATVTVGATNDGDAANNVSQSSLEVRPFVDVAVSVASTQDRTVITGETTTIDATITTGKNPVPGVRLVPWASNGSGQLAIDSLTIGGVDCPQTQPGSACELGTLPAHAAIPVRAIFRAVAGDGSTYAVLDVYPDRDSNNTNNHLGIQIFTVDKADLQLLLARNSVTADNGAALEFPRITVQNGAKTSRDITVDIPLPSFVAVTSVSSFGACTGTTTLQCTFVAIPANDSRSIDIDLTATAAGTFTSNVTMHSNNDSTANNNTGSVVFTVTAATAPPPPVGGGGGSSSGGGGSGGGGRIEWFALLILGALALRRGRRDWLEGLPHAG